MRKLKCALLLALLSISIFTIAQKSQQKFKFGDVSPKDFEPKVYDIDTNANAIVLADIGTSYFESNGGSGIVLEFEHFKRIRVLNKNGFNSATIEIPLYVSNSSEERLEKLKAVTYNLEDGKVVSTKLDDASFFKDKYDEHHTIRKFTFSNLKEGSIIEYQYRISSPYFFNLQPWDFQERIPCLWSEYQTTIPTDIFEFVTLKQGYLSYLIDTSFFDNNSYFRAAVTSHWAMQNIPALKEEKYITTLNNYRARIEFQLKRVHYSDVNVEDIMGDWNQLVERLMKREDFGVPLLASNGWMNDDLKKIIAGEQDDYSKAKKVYEYFRDNFVCTRDEGLLFSKTIKKVFEDKSGTVADINLLLVAALKRLNFEATPAILSTREHGWASELYPIIDRFNYVICRVKIGNNYYLLDASDKFIGFGKLPEKVYNGSARVIADLPILVDLSADSVRESKLTTLFVINDSNNLSGSFSTQYGNFKSEEMREKLSKVEPTDYLKEVKKEFSSEAQLSNLEIDSLKIPDQPLTVKYNMDFNFQDDIIYFNPVLDATNEENPFKAAERVYPVEMPACIDETYIFNMEVPKGYKVEELPKSARVMLNEDEGMFEYLIAESGGRIQLRCHTAIKKANFDPSDYQTLRDFFGYIVKKQAEQIVFKKL